MIVAIVRLFITILSVSVVIVTAQAGGKKLFKDNQVKNYRYENICEVSRAFLADDKDRVIPKLVKDSLGEFKNEYDNCKSSIIVLNGMSARSRIWLLKEIINYKKSKFSSGMQTAFNNRNGEFIGYKIPTKPKRHELSWEKITIDDYVRWIDKLPTNLRIGNFIYTLKLVVRPRKIDGVINGILGKPEVADTYRDIFDYLAKLPGSWIETISNELMQQKVSGEPIAMYYLDDPKKENEELRILNRCLNGFNLLLDYEVARRLSKGDRYGKLPMVAFLPTLTDLNNFKEMIIGEDVKVGKYNEQTSLVQGRKRCEKAKTLSNYLNYSKSELLTRYALRSLHKPDEDSGDEYPIGKYKFDEKDYISAGKGRQFDEVINEYEYDKNHYNNEAKKFLDGIVEKYINQIRKDGFWGGGIELGIIADIFGVKINVYSANDKPLIIGEDSNGEINLWLEGKHYMCYNPKTGKTTAIVPDGNCLYAAVLKEVCKDVAQPEDYEYNGENYPTTIKDLRNKLADELIDNTEKKGQIRELFASLFKAGNKRQLSKAIFDLPPGDLLEESLKIISISNRFSSFFGSFY